MKIRLFHILMISLGSLALLSASSWAAPNPYAKGTIGIVCRNYRGEIDLIHPLTQEEMKVNPEELVSDFETGLSSMGFEAFAPLQCGIENYDPKLLGSTQIILNSNQKLENGHVIENGQGS